MDNEEFKKARKTLELSPQETANILDVDPRTITKWESSKDRVTSRKPNPVAVRAMQWMLNGFRPPEFPEK